MMIPAKKIRLVNLGPLVFFSEHELTPSIGKRLEHFDPAHIHCLKQKVSTTCERDMT